LSFSLDTNECDLKNSRLLPVIELIFIEWFSGRVNWAQSGARSTPTKNDNQHNWTRLLVGRECPLLAQSGHRGMSAIWSLMDPERTLIGTGAECVCSE
jgi:hypothetical protein